MTSETRVKHDRLDTIHERILNCMKAVSYVQKESKKVNNQYTFVSHDAVTKVCREVFVEYGVLAIPQIVSRSQNGNLTEVDLVLELVNVDKPDDVIRIPSFGYGIDTQDKGPGKAISYAYKYALLKALALETGDDPERDMIPHQPAQEEIAEDRIEEVKDKFSKVQNPIEAAALWSSLTKSEQKNRKLSAAKNACKKRLTSDATEKKDGEKQPDGAEV